MSEKSKKCKFLDGIGRILADFGCIFVVWLKFVQEKGGNSDEQTRYGVCLARKV